MCKLHAAQFSDSRIDAEVLELHIVSEVSEENTTEETSGQCPVVPDLVSESSTAVPDPHLDATSSFSQALLSKIPAVLPYQPKKNAKKKVTIPAINEMHLAVLQKEHIKLDLEIENLLWKKWEIMLRLFRSWNQDQIYSPARILLS